MENARKEITTVVEVANIEDLGTTVTDFIATLPECEHFVGAEIKLGFNQEQKQCFAIVFKTIVGFEPMPMPQ